MTDAEIRAEATTPEKKEALRLKMLQIAVDSMTSQGIPLNEEALKQLGFVMGEIINNALKD